MDRMIGFMNYTGLTMVETDGPYPGYQCNSPNHSHHEDAADSIYSQLKFQSQMYRILRDREIYINQPDGYFYQGGSKTGAMILMMLMYIFLLNSIHRLLFLVHK